MPDCWIEVSLHPESSCDRPTRLQFFMDFLGARANAELLPKFYFILHASHAAFQMVTPKFRPNAPLQTLTSKLIPIICSKAPAVFLSSAHNKVQIRNLYYSLPKTSPSVKRTSTRRTSEHCLGTFKTEEKMFLAP
jgi:hypothetical protein